MKKILLATLFAGLFIFVWAQKAPKKPFYAADGNCIAVVASIQDNTSPVVDNAEVLIVSDKIELKGKVKRYEVDSPFCFYEFDEYFEKDCTVFFVLCLRAVSRVCTDDQDCGTNCTA